MLLRNASDTGAPNWLSEMSNKNNKDVQNEMTALSSQIAGISISKQQEAQLLQSVHTGFQLATLAGPLCHEPMAGVAFILESFDVFASDEDMDGEL